MFEFISNWFGGSQPQTPTPAPAPAPAVSPTPAPAPAPSQDHAPAAPATPAAGATPADPHADAAKPKPVDPKAMADAENTIFKKMDGLWVSGSDRSAILDTLRGKTPEEVAAIKRMYAEHHVGHDLDADLAKNLSGKDLAEAKASMSGDPVATAVASIKNAETGTWLGNVDSDKVQKVLEGIKDENIRKQVAAQVGAEVSGMQSGNDKKMTDALLKGDTATASAIKIDEAQHSWTATLAKGVNQGVFGGLLGKDFGVDKDGIYKAIEDCKDPKQREALVAQYKVQTGGADLNADLDKAMDGANRDVATQLLAGHPAAANAARMKAATEHWFTDKDALYKTMEGKSDADRKQMIADYNSMYGKDSKQHGNDLDAMLKDNLSGLDLEKAKQLEDKGKMDDAFALNYAMHGSFWSTDKQLIKDTLAGKSATQIQDLEKKFSAANGGKDLQTELRQETSGRDGFEIQELMKGEPQTIDEKMARARERYDFERGSGSNFMSKAIVDTFSDKGQLLDQQQARMEELYKKIQSGQASSEEKALLDRVTGYQNLDTKNYQESKDAVTNGAAAVAAITASTVATVLTGGAAAPAEVAIIAALAGGTATIATKAIIQDSGYSNEELRNDLIMTGVNMATGGVMGAAGGAGGALFNAAEKITDSPIAQQMIIQGVSGAVSSGVSNATSTMLAGGDMEKILKSGAMGGLTGGVGGAVTGGLGSRLKGAEMFEGMDPVKAAMLRNAMAGGAGAIASTAIDPDSYKGDSAALMMRWGTAVGGAVVGGIGGGYNEGREEVKTAKAVAAEEQRVAKTGEKEPTPVEKEAIAEREQIAENPAELQEIEGVKRELEQGGTPKLPVEEKVAPSAPLGDTIDQAHVTGPDGTITSERGGTSNELGAPDLLAAVAHVVGGPVDAPVAAPVTEQKEPPGPSAGTKKAQEELARISADHTPTPDDLADVQTTAANTQREANVTPEQRALYAKIDELAATATTPEQFERIRQLEHMVGRPVSERLSSDDVEATLELMKKAGIPVSEQDEAAVAKRMADKAAGHQEALESLQREEEAIYTERDKKTTFDVKKDLKNSDKVTRTVKRDGEDVQVTRREVTVDGPGNLGMGGAGATGARAAGGTGIEDIDRPELWKTLGNKPAGQEADALHYGTTGTTTSDVADHPTTDPALASEIALHVAAQRAESGVGSIRTHGGVSAELEFFPVDEHGERLPVDEHGKPVDPSKVARYDVGVPMQIEGTKGESLVAFKDGLNITTGMGKPNELATQDILDTEGKVRIRQQITAEAAQALKESGQLMSGEAALAQDAKSFEGKKILGIGGGPTSEWAMEHALAGGAQSVEVAGKMPRPTGKLGGELDACEAKIRELIKVENPTETQQKDLQALTAQHDDIIARHVRGQLDEIAKLETQIADPNTPAAAREKAEQARQRMQADLDPFGGSRVDRNKGVLNNQSINHIQADVLEVKPITSGEDAGRIKVTYSDGRSTVVDQVIPSIGQNPDAPGGVNHLLKNMPDGMKLLPVIADGRVVGLQSEPAGITISGAAMTGTLGTNMPVKLLESIPENMRDAVIASMIDHANRQGVSAGSKGIVPGIENVGENPALMHEALQLDALGRELGDTSMDQDELRKAWLKKYQDSRADDGLPDQRFDDRTIHAGKGEHASE